MIFNPRHACVARVTVVVLCVCVCFRGPHLRLAQLSDKLDILAVSVSCSLVWRFCIMASFRRQLQYEHTVVGHFYTQNGLIFRIPSVYYALDFTRAINLCTHVYKQIVLECIVQSHSSVSWCVQKSHHISSTPEESLAQPTTLLAYCAEV